LPPTWGLFSFLFFVFLHVIISYPVGHGSARPEAIAECRAAAARQHNRLLMAQFKSTTTTK